MYGYANIRSDGSQTYLAANHHRNNPTTHIMPNLFISYSPNNPIPSAYLLNPKSIQTIREFVSVRSRRGDAFIICAPAERIPFIYWNMPGAITPEEKSLIRTFHPLNSVTGNLSTEPVQFSFLRPEMPYLWRNSPVETIVLPAGEKE